MNAIIPSLPSLRKFPFYMAIDGLTGYLYGKARKTHPNLTAAIFMIRTLANALFYHITHYLIVGKVEAKGLRSQKIFLINSTIVNLIFIVVLRELNLIGRLFSGLIGLAVMGQLIHRVSYIQNKERELIAAKLE